VTVAVAGLYGIVDVSGRTDLDELTLARAWLSAGISVLQLRMKGAPASDIAAVLDELVPLCAAAGCLLVLNDHVRLAASRPGVGVHLGQADEDPRVARELLGPGRVIGWSTHDLGQVAGATAMGVDYIGYGPVFSAAGKHLAPSDARPPMGARGLGSLSAAVAGATVPVVAIGGIDAVRLPFVLATGVAAVAVISAVAQSPDPQQAAAELSAACRRSPSERKPCVP
jgi:thiamine-phosphate pyrophosphorylase